VITPIVNPFIPNPDFFDRKIRGMWITGHERIFHTHGDLAGIEGVWNAQGQVKGLWYAPVETTWKSGAYQVGSTQKAVKRKHRDCILGFHITETPSAGAEDNESDFSGIFDFEVDPYDDDPEPTTIHIDTDRSGERMLDVLKYENPDFEPEVDPIEQQYFNLILKVRAGQPNWYELDPTTGANFKTVFQSGSDKAEGFIEVENPTDQVMHQKWTLTRATWTVPDVSWKGRKGYRKPGGTWINRTLTLEPITIVQGGVVISLDSKDLMVRDHNYTNALPSLLPDGRHFLNTIPPHTPKTLLPISYKDAPAGGARAELIQPHTWDKPWGGEQW
jgi:hypothetical protein